MNLRFPDNFLWGVGYSSHQVEGNNRNNDWWEWEQKGKTKDKSGWACDSWNRYPIDHKLAQDLGCGGFRLSLEWSRIEPEEGEFSDEAIEHYRKVLEDIKEKGMKRVVTLWHWTLPTWFSSKYGWHKKESVFYFVRYAGYVLEKLGSEIDIFLTINEPMCPLSLGYLSGKFPPGGRANWFLFKKARTNMIEAHNECYDISKKEFSDLPVGITTLYNFFEPKNKENNFLKFTSDRVNDFWNHYFLEHTRDKHDFVGIDYYFHYLLGFSKKYPYIQANLNEKITDFGWEIFPQGIYEVAMDAWERYQKPIYIFENGLADKKDSMREDFIREHLKWLYKSIARGADVRGYFHWSLIDNFEWADGFDMRFGLCEMDYATMKRKPRPSYYYYQKIIKNNAVEV